MATQRARKDIAATTNKIQTMKAAQLSLAEKTAGLSLATLEDPNFPKADLLIALGWVLAREEEKGLTFADYGNRYTLNEITEQLGLIEE